MIGNWLMIKVVIVALVLNVAKGNHDKNRLKEVFNIRVAPINKASRHQSIKKVSPNKKHAICALKSYRKSIFFFKSNHLGILQFHRI